MLQMCRFVKPILEHGAARSDHAEPERPAEAALPRPPLPRPERRRQVQPGAAHDHERHRFSRSVVRDRCAQGHDVGLGNHRHFPRRALAGHRLRAAAPLHGRDRRRVSRLGIRARRNRRHLQRHRRCGARARRRDQDASRDRADPGSRRQGGRSRNHERRRVLRACDLLQRRSQSHVPEDDRAASTSATNFATR